MPREGISEVFKPRKIDLCALGYFEKKPAQPFGPTKKNLTGQKGPEIEKNGTKCLGLKAF
jgi:hypothetical protein